MTLEYLLDGLSKIVQLVPSVDDLDRLRCSRRRGLRKHIGSIPTQALYFWMCLKILENCFPPSVCEEVDWAALLKITEERPECLTLAPGPLVNAKDLHLMACRHRRASDISKQRVWAGRKPGESCYSGSRFPPHDQCKVQQKRHGTPSLARVGGDNLVKSFDKGSMRARAKTAYKASQVKPKGDLEAKRWQLKECSGMATVEAARALSTVRAHGLGRHADKMKFHATVFADNRREL